MATPGKIVLLPSGKRGVRSSGKFAVFGADGQCPICCPICSPCEPFVLASYTISWNYFCWDLTPYQGPGMAPAGSYWRLIEVSDAVVQNTGCVNSEGRLVNLPNQFCSNYSYSSYMQLQIGCLGDDGTQINWPGTVRTPTASYSC
jgi:hypothetical protein